MYNRCEKIDRKDAKPDDLIFFDGTCAAPWTVTHVTLYVGNDYMLHCGKPIGYSRIDTPYWTEHFYAFGRII
ncbi:MAG: NlpC/P60 family protein [Christensenellaceae bacterium]